MSHKRVRSARLGIEVLEHRSCPAITMSLLDGGHTLHIVGDDTAQAVWIIQDDTRDTLTITGAHFLAGSLQLGETDFIANSQSSEISKIVVELHGGNDTFSYLLATGRDMKHAKDISADMGDGNDAMSFVFSHSPNPLVADGLTPNLPPELPPETIRANLRIFATAGSGADALSVEIGNVARKTNVDVQADLGAGRDRAQMLLFGSVRSQARLAVDLAGGKGADELFAFRGYWPTPMRVAPDAILDVDLHGGQGQDVIDVSFQEHIYGRLHVNVDGGLGNDRVEVTLEAAWESTGVIQARARGREGDDLLNVWMVTGPQPPVSMHPRPWSQQLHTDVLSIGGVGFDTAYQRGSVETLTCELVTVLPLN